MALETVEYNLIVPPKTLEQGAHARWPYSASRCISFADRGYAMRVLMIAGLTFQIAASFGLNSQPHHYLMITL